MMRQARFLIAVSALGLVVVPGVRAATFTVTTTTDAPDAMPGDGVCAAAAAAGCTLRAAIQEANALPGADSITIPTGTYSLTVAGAGEDAAATGDLDITGDLTITGATNGETIISGSGIDRVFDIFAPAAVTMSRLTIQSGNAGVDVPGGGIRNAGALTLSLAAILANTAGGDGGGIANRGGGSTQLTNVTITGNTAGARGGGVANDTGGTLQLTNVTVSGNSAQQGGGLDNIGNAEVVNTIIANSAKGGNCSGLIGGTSLGHNLDSGATCLFLEPGDLQNKDPKLAALSDTGTTFVLPLQANSPAIDVGDNANCPSTDQRGKLRPADGNSDGTYVCDIGAYEADGLVLPTPTASATGTTTNTPPPPTSSSTPTSTRTPVGGSISLSRVFGHPGDQVVFSATLSTKGASIARTQNDIAFDSANIPIAVVPTAIPDCSVNPQLQKEATVFTFQPPGCSGATCTAIHAAVLSTINTDPIPDGSVLYTCKVNIAPNAAASEYPLTISAVDLKSPDGQSLPNVVGSSGAIVVVVPTPTRTPGAGDCCQCSGPLVCGPATGGCGSCVVVFGATCDGTSGQCLPFTATPTSSVTPTTSPTLTVTRTSTPTFAPSSTPTPAPSNTPTIPLTATSTATPSEATATSTATAGALVTLTPTETPTVPITATATLTATTTVSTTPTPVATATLSATMTASPTPVPTDSATPTASVLPTATPSATASQTPTATATTTATASATPTTTASASPTPKSCGGDCDHSGDVSISDIVTMVNIAVESAPATDCPAGDLNGDGQIGIDEILTAVGNSLGGCSVQ